MATIQEMAVAQLKRNNDLIEFMCEQMLVIPGDYGVLVTELPGMNIKVQLSHDVPFGEIHIIQRDIGTVADL